MTGWDDAAAREAAALLIDEARVRGLTLGCAESCTAGLVAATIAAVPGASDVLAGGVVSYMLSVKERLLGVSADVLDDPALGAVSEECAAQMAAGAARALGCDVAVSVTGIAGPGGEEPGKPVGTVCFGLWARGETRVERRLFAGGRDAVRGAAAERAMALLCEGVMGSSDALSHEA